MRSAVVAPQAKSKRISIHFRLCKQVADRLTGIYLPRTFKPLFEATWPSGKAGACKALIPGSIPGVASIFLSVAGVAELVDAVDLKSTVRLGRAGSSPAPGTMSCITSY